MKKTLVTVLLLLSYFCASAQWTNTTPDISNTNTGNVGIGTTTPGKKLEIATLSEALTTAPAIRINGRATSDYNGSTLGTIGLIDFYNNYTTSPGSAAQILVTRGTGTFGSGDLHFLTSPSGAAPLDRMIINKDGNVGIGVASPTSLLSVAGNASVMANKQVSVVYNPTALSGSSGGQVVQVVGNPAGASAGVYYGSFSESGIADSNTANLTAAVGLVGTGADVVNRGTGTVTGAAAFDAVSPNITNGGTITNAYGLYVNPMKATGVTHGYGIYQTGSGDINYLAGNVGIGTTDPHGYMLAVNGSFISTAIFCKLASNWPDYVFKPSYALTPLSGVKEYIEKNGHLPDMPSAGSVESTGINVGEMNTKLLKKVEELTLYLIAQDKRNSKLQEQVAALKKRVRNIEKMK